MRVYTILVAAILTLGLTGATIGSAHHARAEGSQQDRGVVALTRPHDACIAEDVNFSGTAHIVSNTTDDGHMNYHVNYNLDGVGATSGATYSANPIVNLTENNQSGNEFTLVDSFSVVEPGFGLVAQDLSVFHMTVNDQGDITSVAVNTLSGCH